MARNVSFEITDLPAIKYRASGKSKWHSDPVLLTAFGMNLTDRAANFVESFGFDKEDMFIFLSRHVANGNIAKKRHGSVFGRFLNWGSGSNPYYIAVSGPYLLPILEFMEMDASANVMRTAEYWLRLDIAESIVNGLAKEIPHKKPYI